MPLLQMQSIHHEYKKEAFITYKVHIHFSMRNYYYYYPWHVAQQLY